MSIFSKTGAALGLISGTLFALEYKQTALLFFVLALVSIAVDIALHFTSRNQGSNIEERKILLTSALEIIDARTRLTVEMVATFRDNVKKYRYALSEEQREFISHLLNAVGNVRINDTEVGSDTLSEEERNRFISENREHLDKIEKARGVIEAYISENT